MLKITKISVIALVAMCLFSCKKENIEEALTSKTWRYVDYTKDLNPSSNPEPYDNGFRYALIGDCMKDDRLYFGTDGILQIHKGKELCYVDSAEIEYVPYFYDKVNNKLEIDFGYYSEVVEVSSKQIKYVIFVAPSLGFDGFIFILQ